MLITAFAGAAAPTDAPGAGQRPSHDDPPTLAGPVPALSAERVLATLGQVEALMRSIGVWSVETPDVADFAVWDDFRTTMYSFQFTIQALEDQLRQAAARGEEDGAAAAACVAETLASLLEMVRVTEAGESFAAAVEEALS